MAGRTEIDGVLEMEVPEGATFEEVQARAVELARVRTRLRVVIAFAFNCTRDGVPQRGIFYVRPNGREADSAAQLPFEEQEKSDDR